jgi:hypothetical protein
LYFFVALQLIPRFFASGLNEVTSGNSSAMITAMTEVRFWHQAEVPPVAKEGRLRLQSRLWQAVHERVYEFTP